MKHSIPLAAALLIVSSFAQAQQAAPAATTAPTSLVVGSGNYFSPIVRDLDKAIAFYRDGLGLEVQARPATRTQTRRSETCSVCRTRRFVGRSRGHRPLRAASRWSRSRARAAYSSSASSRIPVRCASSPRSATSTPHSHDSCGLGAPIVTRGGKPITIGAGTRIIVVKDPDGHFVELSQPAELPATAPANTNVIGVRLRLAVADAETTARFYRDSLGFEPRAPLGDFGNNVAVLDALGMATGQYRVAQQNVPGSGLMYDFVDFKGVDGKNVQGRIQDFGSTRVQLRVRDIDAAIAAFERFGGEVVSTGGKPLALPAGNSTLEVAIVRDPNNLFAVLIEAPPAQ